MDTIVRRKETVSLGKLIFAFWVGVGFAALGLYVAWQERNQDLVDLTDRVATLETGTGTSLTTDDLADRIAALESESRDALSAGQLNTPETLVRRIEQLESEVAAFRQDIATSEVREPDQEPNETAVKRPASLDSTGAVGDYDIEILKWEWFRDEYNYANVRGLIRNSSAVEFEHVKVLVEWYDDAGQFITSKWTFADIEPIPPEETTPFEFNIEYEPAMHSARIRFQKRGDSIIPSPESIIRASEPRG